MNRKILILFYILVFPSILAAGISDKKIGVGFLIGSPTGLTFKSWINDTEAADASISWVFDSKKKFTLQVDLLKHKFDVIHFNKGKVPFYYGLGSRFSVVEDDSGTLGIRGVGGLEYIFQKIPVEVFLEIGPVIEIVPGTAADMTGSLGVRYYY